MAGPPDETEHRLEQSLHRNASEAPSDAQLLDEVQQRVGRRRRTARVAGTVILAAAAVFAITTASAGLRDLGRPEQDSAADEPAPSTAPADGWRWETYDGVELQVPLGWGYDGDPSQWCVDRAGSKPAAYVHRPGASTAVLCHGEVPDLAGRVSYVSFEGAKPRVRDFGHGWVLETRMFGHTGVTVFTDDPGLRSRILGSARVIKDADTNGCGSDHPATSDPRARPRSAGGLGTVGRVESVAVCGYELYDTGDAVLHSGRTFTGTAAAGLVDAIQAAPAGTGPDDPPDRCMPGYRGERIYVLIVHGSDHDQQVIVRYAGCDHNGTDDGTTRHRLTTAILQPILSGSDRAGGIAAGAVGALIP